MTDNPPELKSDQEMLMLAGFESSITRLTAWVAGPARTSPAIAAKRNLLFMLGVATAVWVVGSRDPALSLNALVRRMTLGGWRAERAQRDRPVHS